jgi:UDP-2,3-diacylglucosamine hydrolase
MGAGMITLAGTVRFVSDLHLRPERPDLTERFERFLADCVSVRINSLFILGDLFEYWIGDDDLDDPWISGVVASLAQTSRSGVNLYFQHGNRDFLIGMQFAAAAGAILMPETCVLELEGSSVGAGDTPTDATQKGKTCVLSLHGDTLCTDDREYQVFRQLVRGVDWQRQFLAKSLAVRRAEVSALRQRSKEAVSNKSLEIMDANHSAVLDAINTSQCRIMIHGHTHRPGCEVIDSSNDTKRWVLSDWDHSRGDFLELSSSTLRRVDFSQ